MKNKELKPAEQYTTPCVKVIDIELTQNILQPSQPANQQFGLPNYDDGGSCLLYTSRCV